MSSEVDARSIAAGMVEVLQGFEDPAALLAPDGAVVARNRAWQVHGFEGATFVDGDDRPVAAVLRGERNQGAAVGRRARRAGWQWYRSRVRAVTTIPGVAAVLTHRDITDERRLQLRMSQSPIAHLELDRDGGLLTVNERWEELRGRPVGAELGTRWLRDTPPDERRALLERLARPDGFQTSLSTIGADERARCIELDLEPVLDRGEWIGWHAAATDVTELRALAAAADEALTDDLTGAATRAMFDTTLSRTLSRRREWHPCAVLFVDLDRFKPVNDRLGHAAGDAVLQHVVARITSAVRPADLVARYGGDELAVLLERVDEDVARELGQRLVDAVRQPIAIEGEVVEVGASVGVALTHPGDAVDAVMARADRAMYEAKRAGGGTVVVERGRAG